MTALSHARQPLRHRFARALPALTIALGMWGCEADSFLDPSVVGRWEYTPTVVPILERIDIIEPDDGEFVETTPPTQQDLLPEAVEYEVGPGDLLTIEIFDLIQPDVPSQFERIVDAVGTIDLPQIGRIPVEGLTLDEIREAIRTKLREGGIIVDALVSVQLTGPRQRSFKVYGAIAQPGRYLISEPDYRLLDALTEAGGVSPIIRSIRVIRQIPLTEAVKGSPPAQPEGASQPAGQGENLLDIIQQLSKPQPPAEQPQQPKQPPVEPEPTKPPGAAAPAMFSGNGQRDAASQPEGPTPHSDPPAASPPASNAPPAIDLIESGQPANPQPAIDLPPQEEPRAEREGAWMFLNGKWVQVVGGRGGEPAAANPNPLPANAESSDTAGPGAEELITQRVIEVPTKPLLEGAARYNIVIRPDDIIYVPPPASGNIYVAGPGIARPGTYNMPTNGRITLTKAIVAAGGLSPIGVPERVDLTRMVGDALQATIRLNLRAIFEGTQPDVFLKPDDVVNVGTNFWAQPLAIIRNGFRMSYGFGFLLDRNFGNDVFGAPPINVANQRR